MKSNRIMIAVLAGLAWATVAKADSYSVSDSWSFSSSLQPMHTLNLPKFNDGGGSLTLTNVLVEILHDGSATLKADNDDPFDHGTQLFAGGQIVRTFDFTGPAALSDTRTKVVNTALVPLDPDNGDGPATFDGTGPDGHDFGAVGYSTITVPYPNQPLAGYTGLGTADFDLTPDVISQTVQFSPYTPDRWQLEVENPILNIGVRVTYTYTPEPASLALLSLGGLALIRRRR